MLRRLSLLLTDRFVIGKTVTEAPLKNTADAVTTMVLGVISMKRDGVGLSDAPLSGTFEISYNDLFWFDIWCRAFAIHKCDSRYRSHHVPIGCHYGKQNEPSE